MSDRKYCIVIYTVLQGRVAAVMESSSDPEAEDTGQVCLFDTERKARLEIVDNLIIRLVEFIEGERDFEDAISVEEYVAAQEDVTAGSSGTVID